MCRFIRRPEPQADQVLLTIEAAGGKLTARLTPPEGAPHMIFLDHVPLLRAVKMAALMADLLDTDVISGWSKPRPDAGALRWANRGRRSRHSGGLGEADRA